MITKIKVHVQTSAYIRTGNLNTDTKTGRVEGQIKKCRHKTKVDERSMEAQNYTETGESKKLSFNCYRYEVFNVLI